MGVRFPIAEKYGGVMGLRFSIAENKFTTNYSAIENRTHHKIIAKIIGIKIKLLFLQSQQSITFKIIFNLMNDIYVNFKDSIYSWSNDLPHLEQDGKMQFVTFRLADSLPQSKLAELQNIRDTFIHRNPLPWDNATKLKYSKVISEKEEYLLNEGLGSCVLRDPNVRKIVDDAMKYVDGKTTDILGYVIMPNHVHLLHIPFQSNQSGKVVGSIRRFTALTINRMLHRSGSLWQRECFDRFVRSEEHFKHCISYIINNPRFLPANEYSLGGRVVMSLLEDMG